MRAFYQEAKANGCDWASVSHHHDRVSCSGSVEMDWHLQNVDPLGLQLPDLSYTLEEIEFLAGAAAAEDDPGTFTAAMGMEFTTTLAPTSNRVGGGHKVALFLLDPLELPLETFRVGCGSANTHSVEDWHEYVDEYGGVSEWAHPCASQGKACYTGGNPPADFTIDPQGSIAYEFGFNARSHVSDADGLQFTGCECTYGYALGLGLHIGASSQSDSHYRPGQVTDPPCTTYRTIVWATANTREDLADAYRLRRTYFSRKGEPEVRFWMENSQGEAVTMGGDLAAARETEVVLHVEAASDPVWGVGNNLAQLNVYHNGTAVVDEPCPGGLSACSYTQGFADEPFGYWFVVIERNDGSAAVITSPIWINAAIPTLPPAAPTWIIGVALGVLFAGVVMARAGRSGCRPGRPGPRAARARRSVR